VGFYPRDYLEYKENNMIPVKDITTQPSNWQVSAHKVRPADTGDNVFSQIFDNTRARFSETTGPHQLQRQQDRQSRLEAVNADQQSDSNNLNEDRGPLAEDISHQASQEQKNHTTEQPAQNEPAAQQQQTTETENIDIAEPTEQEPVASENQPLNVPTSTSESTPQIMMSILADQPDTQVVQKPTDEGTLEKLNPQETNKETALPAAGKNVSPQLKAQPVFITPLSPAQTETTSTSPEHVTPSIKVVANELKTPDNSPGNVQSNVASDSEKTIQIEKPITIINPEPKNTSESKINYNPASATQSDQNLKDENAAPKGGSDSSLSDRDTSNFQKPDTAKQNPLKGESNEPAPAYHQVSLNENAHLEHQRRNSSQMEITVLNSTKSDAMDKPSVPNNVPHMLGLDKSDQANPAEMQENIDRVVKAARAAVSQHTARIQIRLEPPELGLLRIEIKQNASGLQLQLQATNAKAHQLLQQNSAELRNTLEANGIHPRQINIQLRMDLRNDHNSPAQQDAPDLPDRQASEQQAQDYSQQDHRHDHQDNESASDFMELKSNMETDAAEENSTESENNSWRQMNFATVDLKI
jgi:flagellar hook-length control protein FliK